MSKRHLNTGYLQTHGVVHGQVGVKNVGGVTDAAKHEERAGTRGGTHERDREIEHRPNVGRECRTGCHEPRNVSSGPGKIVKLWGGVRY